MSDTLKKGEKKILKVPPSFALVTMNLKNLISKIVNEKLEGELVPGEMDQRLTQLEQMSWKQPTNDIKQHRTTSQVIDPQRADPSRPRIAPPPPPQHVHQLLLSKGANKKREFSSHVEAVPCWKATCITKLQ